MSVLASGIKRPPHDNFILLLYFLGNSFKAEMFDKYFETKG